MLIQKSPEDFNAFIESSAECIKGLVESHSADIRNALADANKSVVDGGDIDDAPSISCTIKVAYKYHDGKLYAPQKIEIKHISKVTDDEAGPEDESANGNPITQTGVYSEAE